ncbi:MAG: hypothetical protein M1829_004188 [Trizodia sp. TS-e1964]|nr:MAG: hypothetical protein M1829_004188 [Trizodia sp. TS-e1964]
MTESELPQITFASVKECESLDGENSSDSEYQHALEPSLQVVFPNDDPHRRKSSIVATANARELALQHQTASCFVHSLLETNMDHHAHGEGGGDGRDYRALAEMADEEPSGGGNGSYTRSRLLTKKQLADMAWGVRELSRRLTSLRVKMKVQSIFVLTKAHDEALIADTREVTQWLLSADRGAQYTVYVEQTLEGNKKFDAQGLMAEDPSFSKRLKYWTNELAARHPHTFDFVITLGGDGTVLYASWLFQRIVPPVLSFSMGSLGFLTKFDYGNYRETLTAAFQDGVTVSLRLRFEGTVMRAHKKPDGLPRDLVEELVGEESEGTRTHYPDGSYEILNDIVVDRGPNASKSLLLLLVITLPSPPPELPLPPVSQF